MSSSSKPPLRDALGREFRVGDLLLKAARFGNYAKLFKRRVLRVDDTGVYIDNGGTCSSRRIQDPSLCVILTSPADKEAWHNGR